MRDVERELVTQFQRDPPPRIVSVTPHLDVGFEPSIDEMVGKTAGRGLRLGSHAWDRSPANGTRSRTLPEWLAKREATVHAVGMSSTNQVVSPTEATPAPEVPLARSIRALLSWHDIKANDLDALIGLPKSTVYRRFKVGDWELDEVRALAYLFGLSVDQLTTGRFVVADSQLAGEPWRLSRQLATADETAFSGSDMDSFLDAAEATAHNAA